MLVSARVALKAREHDFVNKVKMSAKKKLRLGQLHPSLMMSVPFLHNKLDLLVYCLKHVCEAFIRNRVSVHVSPGSSQPHLV